ncbi:MAG: hypothetical protein KGH94_00845 [Candidatus Micrarchaeota archaeon]|nr:hypothetical protein [Candidatus Micrarchaeota archaeon]
MPGRTRQSRLRESPDEVGIKDGMAIQRSAELESMDKLRRQVIPVQHRHKPVGRFSVKGKAEAEQIPMTRSQFDGLGAIYERLKHEALKLDSSGRVLEDGISFSHLGAIRIRIPGLVLSEPIDAAELVVRYIGGAGNVSGRSRTKEESDDIGMKAAIRVLEHIAGGLKKVIRPPERDPKDAIFGAAQHC